MRREYLYLVSSVMLIREPHWSDCAARSACEYYAELYGAPVSVVLASGELVESR